MNPTAHITLGLVGASMIAVAVAFTPVVGGLLCMVVAGILAIAGLIRGWKLPLHFRVLATGVFFYCGYSMCLHGRTMEPGLSRYTLGMALTYFAIGAFLPGLSLIRLWHARLAFSLIGLLLPVSLGAALTVAAVEEQVFIRRYRDTGVGPLARWTVSHHWLSYDRESQRLNGSD